MAKIFKALSIPREIDLPKPAKKYIPEWYSKSERFVGGEPRIKEDGSTNKALKMCHPFLDSLMSGYVVELWSDLEVTRTLDGPTFKWLAGPSPVSVRETEPTKHVPVPMGCAPERLIWTPPYTYRTPNGYSVLVTHPLNRFDLPFTTLSGVIDSDHGVTLGNYPFFLKKNFEGIIPSGTPIMQIIPFKRDSWRIEEDSSLEDLNKKITFEGNRSLLGGFYKKNFWSPKNYE